jgi:hypothetical protein
VRPGDPQSAAGPIPAWLQGETDYVLKIVVELIVVLVVIIIVVIIVSVVGEELVRVLVVLVVILVERVFIAVAASGFDHTRIVAPTLIFMGARALWLTVGKPTWLFATLEHAHLIRHRTESGVRIAIASRIIGYHVSLQ